MAARAVKTESVGSQETCGEIIIFLRLHWVFIAEHGLSLVAGTGHCSLVAVGELLISGAFSCGPQASRQASFSSYGTWTQEL